MRVVTYVPDRDTPFLQKGERATIALDAFPDRVFEGKVARTAYAEDPESRTLRAEFDLANADGRLRPGLFGLCTIYLARLPNRLTIPPSAIVGEVRRGVAACFRVQDGRAVRTEIKVGADDGKRVEVLEGLKEGDTVVADTKVRLSDGQPVESQPAAQTP